MTNPKIKPCPRCKSAQHMVVYTYEGCWRHVECEKCLYLGPGYSSIKAAIKAHNATIDSHERIVNVILENREDGGISVYSDELPGLILSGRDRNKVIADVEPAVRAILEHRGVKFKSLRIDATLLAQEDSGKP